MKPEKLRSAVTLFGICLDFIGTVLVVYSVITHVSVHRSKEDDELKAISDELDKAKLITSWGLAFVATGFLVLFANEAYFFYTL